MYDATRSHAFFGCPASAVQRGHRRQQSGSGIEFSWTSQPRDLGSGRFFWGWTVGVSRGIHRSRSFDERRKARALSLSLTRREDNSLTWWPTCKHERRTEFSEVIHSFTVLKSRHDSIRGQHGFTNNVVMSDQVKHEKKCILRSAVVRPLLDFRGRIMDWRSYQPKIESHFHQVALVIHDVRKTVKRNMPTQPPFGLGIESVQ